MDPSPLLITENIELWIQKLVRQLVPFFLIYIRLTPDHTNRPQDWLDQAEI